MAEFKLPTETVELPSKGLLYPEDSPLASGTIEMKYMTAKEEDILTNQNYISNGTVIDKLLQSLIVTPNVDYKSLLIGDKNAIMVAARILSYGKDYEFTYLGDKVSVDLSELETKEVDYNLFSNRKNDFEFKLPFTDNIVSIKLLSHDDENKIEKEIQGLKKLDKQSSSESTTRLKHMITSINGSRESKDIRDFVDQGLLAKDARALRDFYKSINPDVLLQYTPDGGEEARDIPIGIAFFWPDL
jgi:hypothetical protein